MSSLTIIIFSLTLLVAVLLSGKFKRSLLSTSVLFLAAGFFTGNGGLHLANLGPDNPFLSFSVELALVSVLFTDGLRLKFQQLRDTSHLAGRALFLGMPITLLLIALIAHFLLKLPWLEAFLVGAVLSPTDPVFASLIIKQTAVPERLRQLLNVESGVNDGLALPAVFILMEILSRKDGQPLSLIGELAGGVILGIVLPWIAIQILQQSVFKIEKNYEPITAFAIGTLILALAAFLHINSFLAMFSAGITIATLSDLISKAFEAFGENITELLKLFALFFFGLLLNSSLFLDSPLTYYLFAFLMLLIARPLAIIVSLSGTELAWSEKLTAAWFGPKGFASIFYALLVWKRNIPGATSLFTILALTIVISIVAHSSTDVLFARWFKAREKGKE